MQYHLSSKLIKLEIPTQIHTFKEGNLDFYERSSIDNIRLFFLFFFFLRNNIEGAMNNTSFQQKRNPSFWNWTLSFQIFLQCLNLWVLETHKSEWRTEILYLNWVWYCLMLLLLAKATTTALLSLLLFFMRLLVHIFSLSSEIIVQRARKMRASNTKTR